MTDDRGAIDEEPSEAVDAPAKGGALESQHSLVAALRWLPAVVTAIPLAVLAAVQASQARDPTSTYADWAVLEVGTRSAEHFRQLLGPYSRYGWHHPGPFLFYWNAPFHALSGDQLGGLTLAAAVLNLIVLVGFVLVAGRLLGRVGAWCAALAVGFLVVTYDVERLREAWNPTLTVAMTAAVLVLAVAVASGRRRALPFLVAAASADVQIHIGTTPTVLAASAVALFAVLLWERHALGAWLRSVLWSAGVATLAWVLPVWEQLTHRPGNLVRTVDYFRAGHSTPVPWRQIAAPVAELASGAHAKLGTYSGAAAPFLIRPSTTSSDVLLVAASVLLPALAARFGPRQLRRVMACWAAVGAVALAAAMLSGRNIDGPPYLYLFAFVSGFSLFLHTGAVAAALLLVGEHLPKRLPRRPLALAVLLLLASTSVIAAGVAARSATRVAPYADQQHSAAVARIVPVAESALRTAHLHEVRVSIVDVHEWPIAAGIIDDLERDGFDVSVDPDWTFMFGRDHASTPGQPVLSVASLGGTAPPRDAVLIARTATTVVSLQL